MNIAIILAAGTSSRYSKKKPKQFDDSFNKKMLIEYSIETFIKHSKIDKVIFDLFTFNTCAIVSVSLSIFSFTALP